MRAGHCFWGAASQGSVPGLRVGVVVGGGGSEDRLLGWEVWAVGVHLPSVFWSPL